MSNGKWWWTGLLVSCCAGLRVWGGDGWSRKKHGGGRRVALTGWVSLVAHEEADDCLVTLYTSPVLRVWGTISRGRPLSRAHQQSPRLAPHLPRDKWYTSAGSSQSVPKLRNPSLFLKDTKLNWPKTSPNWGWLVLTDRPAGGVSDMIFIEHQLINTTDKDRHKYLATLGLFTCGRANDFHLARIAPHLPCI